MGKSKQEYQLIAILEESVRRTEEQIKVAQGQVDVLNTIIANLKKLGIKSYYNKKEEPDD